ncbi:MAG: phosphosulfolactate synthase [Acidimicrobiales bacterium]
MPDPEDRAFPFLPINTRQAKPRTRGLTEIRGPYYTPMGPHYLQDVLDTMGAYVDILKFSGGSFTLMPRSAVARLVELAHQHQVRVSTGGFLEHVLPRGPEIIDRTLAEAAALGFDIVEVSAGFLSVPDDDLVRLSEQVIKAGLAAKPEIGIQFGAGGATAAAELAAEGTRDIGAAIRLGRRHLDAGAHLLMIESEGITESVEGWRTDAVAAIVDHLGLDRVMFEAAEPAVFEWYVKNYGPEVNLFVDHSQIVQLESLRSGIWGTKSTWGRVVTYKPGD